MYGTAKQAGAGRKLGCGAAKWFVRRAAVHSTLRVRIAGDTAATTLCIAQENLKVGERTGRTSILQLNRKSTSADVTSQSYNNTED
jgi:hypothetical protein